MSAYLNTAGIPLSLAVFLATDTYDHNPDPKTISATSLIRPIRQTILSRRVPVEQNLTDIMNLVPSRMGSAIHDAIERAWKDNYINALKALRYPDRVIQRIKINPKPEELGPDVIPVYLEQRAAREVMGYTVTGKFDFVAEGRVEDFKSTGVYSWINDNRSNDYILQGSIYRWLNPEIITQDTMAIQFIFTDWQAARARSGDPNYPANRVMQRIYHLKPLAEIDTWIRQRIKLLDTYQDAEESELPLCTDEELWRSAPQYKYYKNPKNQSRSTKNFDNRQDAYARFIKDGSVGLVKEVPGQAVACKYCAAFPICSQKDALIAAGELDL